jgi:hypothetical protein
MAQTPVGARDLRDTRKRGITSEFSWNLADSALAGIGLTGSARAGFSLGFVVTTTGAGRAFPVPASKSRSIAGAKSAVTLFIVGISGILAPFGRAISF